MSRKTNLVLQWVFLTLDLLLGLNQFLYGNYGNAVLWGMIALIPLYYIYKIGKSNEK